MDDEATHVAGPTYSSSQAGGTPCRFEISSGLVGQPITLIFTSLSAAGEYLARHAKINLNLL